MPWIMSFKLLIGSGKPQGGRVPRPANDEGANLSNHSACKDQERAEEEAEDGTCPKAHEGRGNWQHCSTSVCSEVDASCITMGGGGSSGPILQAS